MKDIKTSLTFERTKPIMLILLLLLASNGSASLLESGLDSAAKETKVTNRKLGVTQVIENLKTGIFKYTKTIEEATTPCVVIPLSDIPKYFTPQTDLNQKFTYNKCPFQALGVSMAIAFSFHELNTKSAKVFVVFAHTEEGKVHPYEFKIKQTLSVSTEPKEEAKSNEEVKALLLSIEIHVAKIMERFSRPKISQIAINVWEMFGPCFIRALDLQPIVIDTTFVDSCDFKGDVKVAAACSKYQNVALTKEVKLTLKIIQPDKSKNFVEVTLQLGSSQLSLQVPASTAIPEPLKKTLNDSFKEWLKAIELENQPSTFKESGLAFIDQLKSDCYKANMTKENFVKGQGGDIKAGDKAVILERGNTFDMIFAYESAEEKCKTAQNKVNARGPIKLFFYSYQYGYFNYGHLMLDSLIQRAEYLLDLSQKSFLKSIKEEFDEFVKEEALDISMDAVLLELKLEDLVKFVKEKAPDLNCISGGTNIIKCADINGVTAVIITEYTDPTEADAHFKVRFIYPAKALEKRDPKTGMITNQILLQAYNSFEQTTRLVKPLQMIAESIPKKNNG